VAAAARSRATPLLADAAQPTARLQQGHGVCLLPALSAHTTAHTYHGGRDEDDNNNNNNKNSSGDDHGDARMQEVAQVRRLRDALRSEGGGGAHPPLPETAARRAMLDPIGLLMASRSVPLGISLKLDRQHAAELAAAQHTQLDAEDVEQLQAAVAAYSRQEQQHEQQPEGLASRAQQRGRRRRQAPPRSAAAAAVGASADEQGGDDGGATSARVATAARLASDPARALEQLEHLIAAAKTGGDMDSWGTTTQSAAEIAQRIAESNKGAPPRSCCCCCCCCCCWGAHGLLCGTSQGGWRSSFGLLRF